MRNSNPLRSCMLRRPPPLSSPFLTLSPPLSPPFSSPEQQLFNELASEFRKVKPGEEHPQGAAVGGIRGCLGRVLERINEGEWWEKMLAPNKMQMSQSGRLAGVRVPGASGIVVRPAAPAPTSYPRTVKSSPVGEVNGLASPATNPKPEAVKVGEDRHNYHPPVGPSITNIANVLGTAAAAVGGAPASSSSSRSGAAFGSAPPAGSKLKASKGAKATSSSSASSSLKQNENNIKPKQQTRDKSRKQEAEQQKPRFNPAKRVRSPVLEENYQSHMRPAVRARVVVHPRFAHAIPMPQMPPVPLSERLARFLASFDHVPATSLPGFIACEVAGTWSKEGRNRAGLSEGGTASDHTTDAAKQKAPTQSDARKGAKTSVFALVRRPAGASALTRYCFYQVTGRGEGRNTERVEAWREFVMKNDGVWLQTSGKSSEFQLKVEEVRGGSTLLVRRMRDAMLLDLKRVDLGHREYRDVAVRRERLAAPVRF